MRKIWLFLVSALTVLAFVIAPTSAGAASKVEICHFDSVLGTYKKISVNQTAVPSHLAYHPDGFVGDPVPGMRGYEFGVSCAPVSLIVTINFDDVDTSGGEVQLGTFAGFSWAKAWVYRPGTPDPYGYTFASAPNVGFIGHPQVDGLPLVLTSQIGDVSFTSVFLSNPSGSATDPDGPITITIEAFDDGSSVGTQEAVLADGAFTTVAISFDSVDRLELSATGSSPGGKYFALDDLGYFPA